MSLPAPPPVTSYVDGDSDELYLEDQSGRVRLVGDVVRPGSDLALRCVTGAVAGVIGTETPEGDLQVHSVHFPGLPPPVAPSGAPTPGDIVLASGLRMGGDAPAAHELALEMLAEFLTGELAPAAERGAAARISTLVLAGDSVESAAWMRTPERHASGAAPNPFAAFDPWLEQVCATLDAVVVLPGARDPSSVTLPQQPLLAPLMPRAARHASLHLATNPAWFGVHHRAVLATSGQAVEDLLRYLPDDAQAGAALPLALATLQWSHVAPTAPDTLCTSWLLTQGAIRSRRRTRL